MRDVRSSRKVHCTFLQKGMINSTLWKEGDCIAIYHLQAKVISRGAGRSAVSASAYLSCSRMYNDYDGIQHDYTRKHGLIHQEVLLPSHANPEWIDREKLWNAVEETEKTKDSRLAREFVVALPIELDKGSWLELLRNYIQTEFVDAGMCADFAIHDIDGHNPHAHIMLTVRPLNENGTWQHKTEKEYLCIRNGEEKGFTASEFKTAQLEGWEKQYSYKVGKKNVFMTPSEADKYNYERVNKYPKSTKFGRQNPLTERWNSDEQLLLWRERWATATNQMLETHNIAETIDHRSFAEQGLIEQPTIHEGYAAQLAEKKGLISERCELNRQIRADNKLLKELKKQVNKLTKAISESIPAIAEALETIRERLILIQYQLLHNESQSYSLTKKINSGTPVFKEYYDVKQLLNQKTTEKKELSQQKKNTGFFNPIRHIQLSQQITTLTEEIEELKNQKNAILIRLGCDKESDIIIAESNLKKMNETAGKLSERQKVLEQQKVNETTKFHEWKSKIAPEQELELLDERISLRENHRNSLICKLQEVFGRVFRYERLREASEEIDYHLNEDPDIVRKRTWEKRYEQAQEKAVTFPHSKRKQSVNFER